MLGTVVLFRTERRPLASTTNSPGASATRHNCPRPARSPPCLTRPPPSALARPRHGRQRQTCPAATTDGAGRESAARLPATWPCPPAHYGRYGRRPRRQQRPWLPTNATPVRDRPRPGRCLLQSPPKRIQSLATLPKHLVCHTKVRHLLQSDIPRPTQSPFSARMRRHHCSHRGRRSAGVHNAGEQRTPHMR